MRILLPKSAAIARAMGIDYDGEVRVTSAPFWGESWAPADLCHIVLAANPWGNTPDPALLRRVEPVSVALGRCDLPPGIRVVVEKPFGEDLASARRLNTVLHQVLPDDRVFRVDHFLAKQTVLNHLRSLRLTVTPHRVPSRSTVTGRRPSKSGETT